MKKVIYLILIVCIGPLSAQESNVILVKDAFINIASDARAAGQADIGVATAPDAFSQFWNPAKYLFSDKKFEIGVTQILGNKQELNEFSQVNISFYNKLNERSAYALSIRHYAYAFSQFDNIGVNRGAHEFALDGSYTLRLGKTFAMSVGARFISLKAKNALLNDFFGPVARSLYGIDVSGYYKGNEKAFKKFNGRWRAGFHVSNLRGKSENDNTFIEIYAPSLLKVGTGFDFILNQDKALGITAEYKMLLDSYIRNTEGEQLDFGLEGTVAAVGLDFNYREKVTVRTGYSHGINRLTDSFAALGAGFKGRYADIDIAFLFGLSEEENPIRQKLRVSLSLNLEEVFLNERLFPQTPD